MSPLCLFKDKSRVLAAYEMGMRKYEIGLAKFVHCTEEATGAGLA